MITKPINTNIITGFLGVGKTTLIKALLAHKPNNEVWAVLVNEFGEIGIDGGLLNSASDAAGVVIKEVPGGCLCCAAGVPTQVAINQIIQQAKPDRLLIEPTGLGHPAEIVKLLQAPHLQNIITLQTSLCLVDARKVSDSRYCNHDIFIQQLQIADTVIANKAQHYDEQNLPNLVNFMTALGRADTAIMLSDTHFSLASQVEQIVALLNQPSHHAQMQVAAAKPPSMLARSAELWFMPQVGATLLDNELQQQLAVQGYVYKTNQGEGCYSYGWIIDSQQHFDFELFMDWVDSVKSLAVLRLKAIVITFDGILSVNMVDDKLTLDELDDALDSRIEIISDKPLDGDLLQQQLFSCY